MIIQSLGMAFAFAFSAIATFGHLLLVRAVFTPTKSASRNGRRNRRQIGRELAGLGITP